MGAAARPLEAAAASGSLKRELGATLALGWPIVLANVAIYAMTATDFIMLGRLSPQALAAGALGFNLFQPAMVLGIGIVAAQPAQQDQPAPAGVAQPPTADDICRALEQAAEGLGASRARTLLRVTLPLLRPSLVSAGLLAFISSFDELVVALFLAGSAAFRDALRIGAGRYRLTAAVVALAASWVGVTLSVAAEMAVLTLIVAAALAVERRAAVVPDSVDA